MVKNIKRNHIMDYRLNSTKLRISKDQKKNLKFFFANLLPKHNPTNDRH